MIYSGRMTTRFFCFFPLAFVCATSGTNVNDIRRIDFKNFRYPWDEPDESNKLSKPERQKMIWAF
jgi:hypothetical protein